MCQIDTGGTRVLRKRNCRKPASSLVTQALTLACIRDRRCRCTNTSAAGYTVSRICSDRCVRVICREGAGYRAFQNLSMISSGDFVDRNVFILVSFDYFFFFFITPFRAFASSFRYAIWKWFDEKLTCQILNSLILQLFINYF